MSLFQTVGETIAGVLNEAINKGLIKISDIHLIGHSLGAHLSGYIARNLKNRPPVIVGELITIKSTREIYFLHFILMQELANFELSSFFIFYIQQI